MKDVDRGPGQNPTLPEPTPRYPGFRVVSFGRLEAAAEVRAQRDRARGTSLSIAGAERRSRTIAADHDAPEVILTSPNPSLGEE
jgi:hypothetical protein